MIYALRRHSDGAIKLGYSADVDARISSLEVKHGRLDVLGIMDGDRATERTLHARFSALRKRSDSEIEWFDPSRELLDFIAVEMMSHQHSAPVTVKVDGVCHAALLLLKKRHEDATGEKTTVGSAVWDFIEKHDPAIAIRARRIQAVRLQYEDEIAS